MSESKDYTEVKMGYLTMCRELLRHNYLYYVLDSPIIEDAVYDRLLRTVQDLEKLHPDWVHPESPTQVVGHPVFPGHFKLINRVIPMLSLDNVFTPTEAIDWTVDIHGDILAKHRIDKSPKMTIYPEWKMDGLSLDLEYHFGVLNTASTRGDGTQGEDVTPNALMIEGIPRRIKNFQPVHNVRGEVLPRLADYNEINRQLEIAGKKTYANPRNYAAGSLRLKDPLQTKERKLCFVAHGPETTVEDPDGHWEKDQQWLKDNGFMTADTGHRFSYNPGLTFNIPTILQECLEKRPDYPFEVDGIVLKVGEHAYRKELGFTSRFPRWARAYKFPASTGITKLLSVDRQVGRTGKLTPMARISPIKVHGTTISNVTIHNLNELNRHKLFADCEVEIKRAGDVIPYLERRVTPHEDQPVYGEIECCPECLTKVVIVEGKQGSRTEYCPNSKCPGRQVAHLEYAAGRDVLNIKGLGDEIIKKLYKQGIVDPAKPLGLLYLNTDDFRKVGQSERMAVKLDLAVIQARRDLNLTRAITALGIDNVAESTAEDLARHFRTMYILAMASVDDLLKVPGVGGITAQSIFEYFDADNRVPFKESVWHSYVGDLPLEAPAPLGTTFEEGTTFVVTGSKFGYFKRVAVEKYLKSEGAKVTSSVTNNTKAIFCGSRYTAHKLDKAKELGIPWIVYDESGVVESSEGFNIQIKLEGI